MISFGQAETAAMTFDKIIHDFGGVMKGDVVITTFKLMKTIYYRQKPPLESISIFFHRRQVLMHL